VRPARSADYLFVTNVSDVRANWVNPAGLAVLPEASVFAELVVEHTLSQNLRLAQYSVGFSSRGLSVAYQRDRFETDSSTSVFRVGYGLPIPRGAIGFATSWYGAPGDNQRGLDLGIMYGIIPRLTLGATARNIGRPEVGTAGELPIVLTGGAQLALLGGRLQLAAQGNATERLGPATGYDNTYRGGINLVLPTRRPIVIVGAADLASNFRIDRLHLGFAIGGRTHVAAIGTGISRNNTSQLDRLSVTGVASNTTLRGR